MTEGQQLAGIERALGSVQGTLDALVKEIARDRDEALDCRSRLYARVEKAEETTVIASQVAVQAREEIKDLKAVVYEDMKPQTDRLKNVGLKASGFLAAAVLFGGLSQSAFAHVVDVIGKIFKGP